MGHLYYPEFFLQVPSTFFTMLKSSRFKRRIARDDRMFRRETRALHMRDSSSLSFSNEPRLTTPLLTELRLDH